MSILSAIRRVFASDKAPSPDDDFWYGEVASGMSACVPITSDRALRVAGVMACVRVLSETVASLPLHVKRRKNNGDEEKAPDHPLYHVLHSKSDKRHTSFEWREMGMNALCLTGNFVCLIIPGSRGSISQLIPVPPSSVKIRELLNGRLAYDITMASGVVKQFTEEEVLHIRGMSLDGAIGLNPIQYARDTIGLTIAAEEHGARFFKSGGRASSHLQCVGRPNKEAKESLSKSIREMAAGGCIVTDEGFVWSPLPITNEDMQFLETRKFQLADIARLYRVPLHLIQEHEKTTSWGTGIESFNRQFVTHTIRPWLVRWEQRINADLFGEGSEYFAEFNVDGLLRGDTLPRYQAHAIGIASRFLRPNEARRIEGMNAIDGGDEFPPIAGAVGEKEINTDGGPGQPKKNEEDNAD